MIVNRVAVGVPLVLLAGAAFLWPGWPGAILFMLLCSVFLCLAVGEFDAMTRAAGRPGYPWPMVVGGFALLLGAGLTYRFGQEGERILLAWDVLVVITFLAAVLGTLVVKAPCLRGLDTFAVSVGGFMYICWCLSFIPKVYFNSGIGSCGRYLTLYLVFVVKAADVGAFAMGTACAKRPGGNHKLVPSLSPKKSWEGLFGGLVASLVVSCLLSYAWQEHLVVFGSPVLGPVGALFFGLFFPIAGLGGDLAESFLKRVSGFKDSGHIPGLGGALDVLDSLIPTAPVFYAYLHIAGTIN